MLAHVPDLNDFIAGLAVLLKPAGVLTMEFPHLLRLIEDNQFDTIYHEHFCYFSLLSAEPAFERHGLKLFDVEELPTHGGSLRVSRRRARQRADRRAAVAALRRLEKKKEASTASRPMPASRPGRAARSYSRFCSLPRGAKASASSAYGAAAKGNTLLNYCGIGTDAIDYMVDRSPHKQGLYLPGSHIPGPCIPTGASPTRKPALRADPAVEPEG